MLRNNFEGTAISQHFCLLSHHIQEIKSILPENNHLMTKTVDLLYTYTISLFHGIAGEKLTDFL
jgi:hypothetical protein